MQRQILVRQHVARLGLVDLHLGDEVVERVEAGVGADTLQEIGGQRLAVEVAVEIEQMGLDHALAVVDGRPAADVGDGGPGCFVARQPAPRGVDAVGQRRQPVGWDDVRGRKPYLASQVLTVDDLAGRRGTDVPAGAAPWRPRRS